MNSGYKVYDAMTSNPVTISKDESIQEAAKKMSENKVASLVVKDKGEFLGIITERDITRRVAAKNLDTTNTKVKDAMSKNTHTIDPTADIIDAVTKIASIGRKQLPVVANGKLEGLLTFKDIMRVQPQLFGLIYEKYQIREEDKKPIHVKTNEGLCTSCGNYSFSMAESEESEMLCPDCSTVFD